MKLRILAVVALGGRRRRRRRRRDRGCLGQRGEHDPVPDESRHDRRRRPTTWPRPARSARRRRYGLVFGTRPDLATDAATPPQSTTTWPVTEVTVKVGDTVKKGDVLATADTTDLKRDLADATNALESAQVSLRAAKTSLSDAEDADVTAQIRQAKIGLYNAEIAGLEGRRTIATTDQGPDRGRHPHRADRRGRHRGQRGRRASMRRPAPPSSSTRRPSRSRPTSSRAISRHQGRPGGRDQRSRDRRGRHRHGRRRSRRSPAATRLAASSRYPVTVTLDRRAGHRPGRA